MRSLTGAVITGFIALVVAGVASAAPTISLIWTASSDAGAIGIGTNSITASVGDVLTLDLRVQPDAGVVGSSVSLDFLSGGSTIDAFYRAGFDGVSDGGFTWFPTASASNTGGAYEYVAGSAVTCPGGALGNIAAGFCGANFHPATGAVPDDLGGGIVGSFAEISTGPPNTGEFTLGQAQFVVVPEPATGGLLALGLGALGLIGRRNA